MLARTDELSAADRDALLSALACSRSCSAPLAPHIAEELWIALGHDGDAQTPWPGVSFSGTGMSRPVSSTSSSARPDPGSRQRTRSCATGLVCHRCDNRYPLSDTVFACPDCSKGLDIVLRLRAGRPSLHGGSQLRAPAEHLALRGAAADRRRLRAGARRTLRRLHAADPRRPARRRAGARQPVPQGRLHQRARASPTRTASSRCRSRGCWSAARPRSAASRPATSARPSPRSRPRRVLTHTCSTPTAWRTPRPAPAWRSARRSARSRATTTKPTAAAAKSPQRPAWTSPTSPCARSTPRAPRRPRLRSSSSSTGTRPITSSPRPPAARCPRDCTRALASCS